MAVFEAPKRMVQDNPRSKDVSGIERRGLGWVGYDPRLSTGEKERRIRRKKTRKDERKEERRAW